jgi:hypothetical protein
MIDIEFIGTMASAAHSAEHYNILMKEYLNASSRKQLFVRKALSKLRGGSDQAPVTTPSVRRVRQPGNYLGAK